MLFRKIESKKQPVEKPNANAVGKRYWLVEITLTSGEILQFYVSGLTQFDADEKALSYTYWMTDEKLKAKLKVFRLMS
jgi:hypothetical protein